MTTGDILALIPGLDRDTLYYYVRSGFVGPNRIRHHRLDRLEFSREDAEKIRLIWFYHKQRFPPKVAYEKAMVDLSRKQLSLW